jgi:hypothetical protein
MSLDRRGFLREFLLGGAVTGVTAFTSKDALAQASPPGAAKKGSGPLPLSMPPPSFNTFYEAAFKKEVAVNTVAKLTGYTVPATTEADFNPYTEALSSPLGVTYVFKSGEQKYSLLFLAPNPGQESALHPGVYLKDDKRLVRVYGFKDGSHIHNVDVEAAKEFFAKSKIEDTDPGTHTLLSKQLFEAGVKAFNNAQDAYLTAGLGVGPEGHTEALEKKWRTALSPSEKGRDGWEAQLVGVKASYESDAAGIRHAKNAVTYKISDGKIHATVRFRGGKIESDTAEGWKEYKPNPGTALDEFLGNIKSKIGEKGDDLNKELRIAAAPPSGAAVRPGPAAAPPLPPPKPR